MLVLRTKRDAPNDQCTTHFEQFISRPASTERNYRFRSSNWKVGPVKSGSARCNLRLSRFFCDVLPGHYRHRDLRLDNANLTHKSEYFLSLYCRTGGHRRNAAKRDVSGNWMGPAKNVSRELIVVNLWHEHRNHSARNFQTGICCAASR